jgi:hypothetical protein
MKPAKVAPHDVVQDALDYLKSREIALTAEIDMYLRNVQRLGSRIAALAVRADRVGVEERRQKEREQSDMESRTRAIEEELMRCQAAFEALNAVEKHSRDAAWRPGPSAGLADGLFQLRSWLELRTKSGPPSVGAFPEAGAALHERRIAIIAMIDSWGFTRGADRRSIRP